LLLSSHHPKYTWACVLRVVQAITRVALLLCLVPRLVNVASCARSIFYPVSTRMPIGTSDEILSFIEGPGVIRVSRVVDLKNGSDFAKS
jgi:hypothetical protein